MEQLQWLSHYHLEFWDHSTDQPQHKCCQSLTMAWMLRNIQLWMTANILDWANACYSKFQISLFLFVTRQKKFIEDDYLKPSPPLLGSAFLHPIVPFFPTMQASIAFTVYQKKSNIFNFLKMVAKCGPTSSLPYRLNPDRAEPRSLCRLFLRHFQKNYPFL